MQFAFIGWGVVFNNIDLDNEYFTPDTKFGGVFKNGRELPLHFEHCMDEDIGQEEIGTAVLTKRPQGIFCEGLVDTEEGLCRLLKEMVAADELGLSTGAATHLCKKVATPRGTRIDRWGLAEISLVGQSAETACSSVSLKKSIEEQREDALIRQANLIGAKRENERRVEELQAEGLWGLEGEELMARIKRNLKVREIRIKHEDLCRRIGINPQTGERL